MCDVLNKNRGFLEFVAVMFIVGILLAGLLMDSSVHAANTNIVTNLYVAPNGHDQWSGTLPAPNQLGTDGPFASLERARNAIRYQRIHGHTQDQFTVLVRGGVYRLSATLILGPEDSGTALNPVIYKAYNNEKPILSGARPILDFELDMGNIYKADLNGTSIASTGMQQLFVGGKRQSLARFPNSDPKDPIGKGFLYVESSVEDGSKMQFKYSNGSVNAWAKANNLEIVIYPGPNYWNNTIPIRDIDQFQRIITLAGNASFGIVPGNRYFFQNIREELDIPGEWYFDQQTKMLYFWPPNKEALKTITVPVIKTILQISGGTAHIRFEGFSFIGCDGTAVIVNGSKDTVIAGCTISNAGGNGIEIITGLRNSVIGNDIFEIGGAGIIISGGDRKTLSAGFNRADNNYVHHIGVFSKSSSGIECRGVGNTVSHNLIHSTPRIGILFDGNDHIIEYNHVHHVNQETQDSGVIYSCARDWTKRGNVVRFNYIHDSGGYGRTNAREVWRTPFSTYGIYLDDWTSGTKVFGNIITNTCLGGILIHSGRDNIIENNIIHEAGASQVVYSSWQYTHPLVPVMLAKMNQMNYTKYPALSTITDSQHGTMMAGNKFLRNIVYYTNKRSFLYTIYGDLNLDTTVSDYNIIYHAGLPLYVYAPNMTVAADHKWTKWKESGMDQNSVVTDPLFKNLSAGNYQIYSNSQAIKIGFRPPPFEKIGPYVDSTRASWPIQENLYN